MLLDGSRGNAMIFRLTSTTTWPQKVRLGAVLPMTIMVAAHGLKGAPPEPSQPPRIRPLRYEEDYFYLRDPAVRTGDFLALEPIKYIPLNQGGDWYLSLGGEIKLEYEFYSNRNFGAAPNDDDGGYLLQRYLLHADLHLGERLRFFGQLYAAPVGFEDGKPSPVDQDNLRVPQAFVEYVLLTASDRAPKLTLRAGRQEMLYGSERLVSVREGLNVRRSFDAVPLIGEFGSWRVDGFFSQPVACGCSDTCCCYWLRAWSSSPSKWLSSRLHGSRSGSRTYCS
jgi:hypothetical protein